MSRKPEGNQTLLDWRHRAAEIPEKGATYTRNADAGERARLCSSLGLIELEHFKFTYRIVPVGGGRYRLSGTLEAAVVQACIVTSEPVSAQIDESVEEEFWPAEQLKTTRSVVSDEDLAALQAPQVEIIEDGVLDIGRLAYELLATALDPYPRRPGAELETPAEAPNSPADSPFLVLQTLGRKGSKGGQSDAK